MQSAVTAKTLLALPMGDAAQLVALPPAGHALLAGGMQPSLVHALYPPLDQAAVADRLISLLARTPKRDALDVANFFDAVNEAVDNHELRRGRHMLYYQMTSGGAETSSFELTTRVMRTIGPRAHQWHGGRSDGDLYAYLAQNAEFVAWWLAQNRQLDLPAFEYKEALSNQLMFWSAVQRILGKGL